LEGQDEVRVGVEGLNDVDEAMVNFNPCKIEPLNEAFKNSRKPLLAGFVHKPTGNRYWIANVHQK
jgi:hypothetical protein